MNSLKFVDSPATLTQKWLVPLGDHGAEVVLIERPDKNIICFSTQIGCAVGCSFCYSGVVNSPVRGLTAEEMGSLIKIAYWGTKNRSYATQWVFSAMGEGEPSLNARNVVTALVQARSRYADPQGPTPKLALSTNAPTLAALSRLLNEVAKSGVTIKVQYSLHAAENRAGIMPLSTKPVFGMRILHSFRKGTGNPVEINITPMAGVNDTLEEAEAIAEVLNDAVGDDKIPWHIKMNRFNPVSISENKAAGEAGVALLASTLRSHGHLVELYATDGNDKASACGQLHYQQTKSEN